MTDISKERIEAVARWAGLRIPQSGTEKWYFPIPDFPNDIAACFKWIVPTLSRIELVQHNHFHDENMRCVAILWGDSPDSSVKQYASSLATAIFLAAEQLMKAEVEKWKLE